MNVFIVASTTDEVNHIVPQHVFTTQELAMKWVDRRAYCWSTGRKKWVYIDDDKTILKAEANLNSNLEYVIWFIVEYELDNGRMGNPK